MRDELTREMIQKAELPLYTPTQKEFRPPDCVETDRDTILVINIPNGLEFKNKQKLLKFQLKCEHKSTRSFGDGGLFRIFCLVCGKKLHSTDYNALFEQNGEE